LGAIAWRTVLLTDALTKSASGSATGGPRNTMPFVL
jgi:hypothetical protein